MPNVTSSTSRTRSKAVCAHVKGPDRVSVSCIEIQDDCSTHDTWSLLPGNVFVFRNAHITLPLRYVCNGYSHRLRTPCSCYVPAATCPIIFLCTCASLLCGILRRFSSTHCERTFYLDVPLQQAESASQQHWRCSPFWSKSGHHHPQ